MSSTTSEQEPAAVSPGKPEEPKLELKPERPWNPPTFNRELLATKLHVHQYHKTIQLKDCLLLSTWGSGTGGGSKVTATAVELFAPYLDVLQKKVVDKSINMWKRNGNISRTLFQQLLATIKRVEFPADFPQENYQRAKAALAEADILLELMDAEAEQIRIKYSEGNLKWVDRLSTEGE